MFQITEIQRTRSSSTKKHQPKEKMPLPKVSIRFCTKCKWNLRSAWYLQELLQTFGDQLGEVSLIPGDVGEFKVLGYVLAEGEHHTSEIVIWDRKTDGGFPDSKFLKQRVKKLVFEDQVKVGAHIEREFASQEALIITEKSKNDENRKDCTECTDCTI